MSADNGNRKRKSLTTGPSSKINKRRKNHSQDDDSSDSLTEDQVPEPQREPSPLPDAPTEKLPEVNIFIYITLFIHCIFLKNTLMQSSVPNII